MSRLPNRAFASTVIAAALLALLSIAGLIHAFTTKKDETVLMVAHEAEPQPVPAGV